LITIESLSLLICDFITFERFKTFFLVNLKALIGSIFVDE